MNSFKAQVIVLNRTNYAEADKIATVLTQDGEKLSIIAKGVRKPKSKLVAAVELFVVSEITYIKGKSKLYTVSSAKIVSQHTGFLDNLEKVQVAYEILKKINKYTDDTAGANYYDILREVFRGLEGPTQAKIVELWAWLRILQESGHNLQLTAQTDNRPYLEEALYSFDIENGGFIVSSNGIYNSNHIKMLKVAGNNSLAVVNRVDKSADYCSEVLPAVNSFVEYHI